MPSRSVVAQCRTFWSSTRPCNSSSSPSRKGVLLQRVTGLTFGWAAGYFLVGGHLSETEAIRGKQVRGVPMLQYDLRDKMWPELRQYTWFKDMEQNWSTLRHKLCIDKLEDMHTYMWKHYIYRQKKTWWEEILEDLGFD